MTIISDQSGQDRPWETHVAKLQFLTGSLAPTETTVKTEVHEQVLIVPVGPQFKFYICELRR